MAATTKCLASLARLSLASATRPLASPASSIPRFLAPSVSQIRCAGQMSLAEKRLKEKNNLRKKRRQQRFKEYKFAVPTGEGEQFSLCDAMRYIRAAEVGRPPSSVTYEVALRVRTIKNSPPIRNRVRLPYPVKNDTRIAVICPEGSSAMNDARLGGAVAYGEESLFAMIKANPNNLPFNRLLCHLDSMQAMNKAGLGRILGPRGLMPSLKTGTVTKNIRGLLQDMVGTETYREKIGVVRMAIGNILFTPKQLSDNVKAFIAAIKDDIERMEDRVDKKIIEVVLSATNSPGFPLNGGFLPTDPKLDPAHLSTTM